MRNLFPEAKPEERIELLKLFAPDPRFPSDIPTSMFDPPILEQFMEDLGKHGLGLKIGWEKIPVSLGQMDGGSLTNKQKLLAKVTIVSISSQTKDVELLINDRLELSGKELDSVMREMAKMLQNDVIRMTRHEQIAYLTFDFKGKYFDSSLQKPKENLPLNLFQKARRFLKEKGKEMSIMNRNVVFAEKVLA